MQKNETVLREIVWESDLEAMTLPGTDPMPFILMAYSVGALGLLGFTHWIMYHRIKLRMKIRVLNQSGAEAKHGQ